MKNWNDKSTKKSASRSILSIITALVLVLQVFGIPGVKVADKELTSYEKAMAALPGWVGADGLPYNDTIIYNNIVCDIGTNPGSKSLVIDNSGYPCLAWSDNTLGNYEIFFTRWSGTTWVNVAGKNMDKFNCNVTSNNSNSNSPSLAIDKLTNYPCIAYREEYDVFYTKWDGNNWVNAQNIQLDNSNGNVSKNSGYSGPPTLMLNKDSYPCIVWADDTNVSSIRYVTYNGNNWCNVNNDIYNDTNSNIGVNGAIQGFSLYKQFPYILYINQDVSGWRQVFCIRYDGVKWVNTQVSKSASVPFSFRGCTVGRMLTNNNNLYICWSMYVQNMYLNSPRIEELFIIKYDGDNWTNIKNNPYSTLESAQITNNNNGGSELSITCDNDIIYIWCNSLFIYWDGIVWITINNNPFDGSNGNINNIPSGDNSILLIDNSGKYIFSWNYNMSGKTSICLSVWDGIKFVCLDGSDIINPENANVSKNSGNSGKTSITLDSSGNPCIAWEDSTNGNPEIYFTRWSGSSWVNATGSALTATNGNVSNNSNVSYWPSLQLDSTGNPCIAWYDGTAGNYEIFYAKLNSSSWVNASGATLTATNGNVSNNAGASLCPSLALDSLGNPNIAWYDTTSGNNEVYFSKWNGSSWVNVLGVNLTATNGNVSNNTGASWYPSLTLNSSDNPCIAWCDSTPGNWEIYFCRWNGSTWLNAPGSVLTATNANVSNNPGSSWNPFIALDSLDNPNIVWYDTTPGNPEIYYSRWNGSSWTNALGAMLTATNSNVSNNSGSSGYPSLVLHSSVMPCIAWHDFTTGNWEIYFARWNGSTWVNASGVTLTATNGNVSNNSGYSRQPSLALDSSGNPCIAWEDSTPGNGEIFFAKWNGAPQQPQPANGIKEFIKEVDTNSDGIFDDNNKPVSLAQTISYRIKLGFEKGMKSSAWVVDKIPYEATYVRGCQPSSQVYYSFPAKNWTFKANVPGEPQENADKGTFIIWKADPANGENQTFMFKVKAAIQSQMPMSLKTNGLMSPANAVSTYSGVKSEPAGLFVPDLSSTMFTNSAYNGFEASEEKLDILDPIESEEWPISTGVRVQWDYTGNAINKDTGLRKSITFEVKTSLGQIISKKSFDIFENNMVATLPLTYSNWDEIVARSKNTSATLTAFIDGKKAKSVNITLARHGVLNYASWADSNSTIKGRHPLIFVHGVNLMSQTSSESEELAFDTLLKSFGNEQNNLFKYFKPYVFHYDSGDLLDSFCDYETPVPYSDLPGAGKTLKGVEAVGFELKKSIESAYNTEPSTFNSMNGMYFVCHSMGGLVTRSFMAEKWNDKDRYFGQDVTRVVTLGTPHHGSPAASLSIGTKNILASQFSTDLSWDDYDISLEDEKSPNMFLKRLNCIPTYIGKSWWVQQSEPTTDCKVDYSYKIVALAGQIAIKNSDGKAWIDDTNNAILGVGHTVSSYLKNLGDIGVITSSFLLPIIGIISFISNPAISVIAKKWLDNVFELTLKTKNGSEEKIAVKDLKPFNKNYVQNDGIVPVESALYTDSLNELYNKQMFESKWSPYPIYYNHFTICTEPDVVAFVAHSICSPILKVSPAVIKPGDYFTIEGKSFGAQRWDSNIFLGKIRSVANPNPVIMTNIQLPTELPIKVISWSNEKIVCQMPSDDTMTNASTMINSSALGDNYQLYLRTGINGIISPITPVNEENPETGTPSWDGKVIVKTKEDRVSLSVWPSKSQLVKGEDVEFTIKAKNTGTSELTNVDIISNIPRELEFISSTIKGVMGKNKLRIQLSRLMPKETTMFKVVCKLDESIHIPEESGLWLLYSANLSSGNNINTAATALVRYFTRKPSENLSMNIIWKGVNTKTNETKAGNPIALTIDVNGGSMPYNLTVDWGDGEKKMKTWNKMFDPKPVFDKTYENQGEMQVTVTCVDAYSKTTTITRLMHIR